MLSFLSLPQQSMAFTWGYPEGSAIGQCLASRPSVKMYPDKSTAEAAATRSVRVPRGTITLKRFATAAPRPLLRTLYWLRHRCPCMGCYYEAVPCNRPDPSNPYAYYWFPIYGCPGSPPPPPSSPIRRSQPGLRTKTWANPQAHAALWAILLMSALVSNLTRSWTFQSPRRGFPLSSEDFTTAVLPLTAR